MRQEHGATPRAHAAARPLLCLINARHTSTGGIFPLQTHESRGHPCHPLSTRTTDPVRATHHASPRMVAHAGETATPSIAPAITPRKRTPRPAHNPMAPARSCARAEAANGWAFPTASNSPASRPLCRSCSSPSSIPAAAMFASWNPSLAWADERGTARSRHRARSGTKRQRPSRPASTARCDAVSSPAERIASSKFPTA